MAILEKITANMELTELKKFKFQKSILRLMLEWKHLEEYMDSTQHTFHECLDQLQHKEKHLNSVQESAMESNRELETVRASIEERMKQLGDKEWQLNEQVSELGLKEKRLVLIENSIDERIREVELREVKLKDIFEKIKAEENRLEERIEVINSREVQLDENEKEFKTFRNEQVNELDLKEKRLVLIAKSVEERVKQVELREKKVQVMFEEFKVEEKQFKRIQESGEEKLKHVELREEKVKVMFEKFKVEEKRFEEIQELFRERIDKINSKQMELDERFQELEHVRDCIERRVKELDAKEEDFEKRLMELDERFHELDGIRDGIERRIKELDAKEEDFEKRLKELDERSQELDGIRDSIERRVKELDAKEEDFDKRLKELESKEKEFSDGVIETESMGKQLSNVDPSKVETELELKDNPVNSRTDIEFCDKMDGKSLQRLLNKREKDHKSMAEEVYLTLQLSPDPAKLALDAMEGFYQIYPNKGRREFKLDVIRKSCILLLEQLLRISPQVKPHVKVDAMELVCQWKAKLSTWPDSMEVLGHLYLLASYSLPIPFNKDELLCLVEIVAEHRQAPELCRLLGFTDRIPDLIRNLVKKKHNLVAVRFVSEFELGDEFPPAGILIDYMKHVKLISKKMLWGNKSCKVKQNEARNKKVAAMREVIRCIKDNKLESEYSPKAIEQTIDQLLMQKRDNKGTAPLSPNKHAEEGSSRLLFRSSINSPILSNVNDMSFILASMDGRSLQIFLNKHFEDHELMRNEVLLALEHSLDPATLVLDAMQGFHLSHFKDHELMPNDGQFEAGVIRSSCILMLEQLMRLKRPVQPQVKVDAMAIARRWKLKMREEIENPQVVLGFLQFIGAFGLTSRFNDDELLCLIEKIASHPHARELCEILGLSEKKPGCVLHPCVKSKGSSLENAPLNEPLGIVNVRSSANDSNSLRISMERTSEVPIFHYVSDPAKLVLDAIRGCYHSSLKKWTDFSKPKIMDKFSSLLEQLAEASPEIKSRVREEAMAFSVDWKSKLSVSRENQAEIKAFLHLLATYKLPTSVLFEVLHRVLEPVRDYKQMFEFLRLLNIIHKIPDYIQYLIEKDERLLAIRFIYEFELLQKFPPVPIIKSHLRYIEKFCTKICEEGDYSHEALDKAADREVGLLRAVIRSISFHEIESDCTQDSLQVLIDKIKKQKEDRKPLIPTIDSMAQKQQELDMKKRAINFEVQTQEQNATKRPRIIAPVAEAQNGAPMGPHEAYPVNPTQGTNYLAWQYGHGTMAPLGWQYNGPDVGASYHGVAPHVIPRPFVPQPTTPYLYRPWQ